MPRVKIIQVLNTYDMEYQATESDIAQITDWEEISDTDMLTLKRWLDLKNRHGMYGSYREGPLYALLIIPENPVSAITSIREVVFEQEKLEAKEAAKRKATRERTEATKLERKRKQLEKLKKELEGEEGS